MASNELSRNGRAAVVISAAVAASLIALLYITQGAGSFAFIPMTSCIPLIVYAVSARSRNTLDHRGLVNESPAVIGMMAVRIGSGGSLDSAVRDVAANGPRCSSGLFRKVVKDADVKICSDIRVGMESVLRSLPSAAASFRRSVQMIIAASVHNDENEKKRMMNDSQELSLRGVREMGETYSSSVSNPCMMVFGLGVMIPMILMSIMPMLSMGGVFSVSFLNENMIAFITLAVIPGIVAMVIFSVVRSNPFPNVIAKRSDVLTVMPLLLAVPLFVAFSFVTDSMSERIVLSLVSAGIICASFLFPRVSADRKRHAASASLEHMLFEVGNRMISGDSFEAAFTGSLNDRSECKGIALAFRSNALFSKGDIAETIRLSLYGCSEMLTDVYTRIYASSVKDVRDAGRLAVSLAHQMQDQTTVMKKTENKLKSMSDMMTVTAMMFAPLIMGLSIVLLKPLSEVAGVSSGTDMFTVLPIYLIELAALVSILTVYMGNRRSVLNASYRFSMVMPVSLIVFMMFSGLSL